MPSNSLSDIRLRRIKPPAVGRSELSDKTVPGLKFRITANGRKTWSVQVNIDGHKRRFTIGEYPTVGLAEARKEALRLRVEAYHGRDPIKERREKRKAREADTRTVSDAIDEYAERQLVPNLRTARERESQLRSALASKASSQISKLTRKDLQTAIDRKATEGARYAANRIRAALVAFSKWCWRRGYIIEDIGIGTSKR
ncbi:Putative prophage CPS-53 integrase [Roseibium album]|nr:Putative prophage CPS-53 integrase [Roseibium album]